MKRALTLLSLALLAAATLGGCAHFGADRGGDDWQVCMKTYTFNLRKMDFFQSVDSSAQMGFKAVEVFPGQKIGGGLDGTMSFKMDEATRRKVLEKCRESGVDFVGYGVARPKDDAECRQLFDFAREMGVQFIVMEPEPEQLALLDKLTAEYGIPVAIHNHPEPSHYWNPETVLNAVKGRNPLMGACADTGHWVRSGLDPVECLKQMDGKIIMLHFKDLKERAPKTVDAAWGEGACDALGMMAELRRQGFKGWFSLEYENADDCMVNVPKCKAFFDRYQDASEAELRAAR